MRRRDLIALALCDAPHAPVDDVAMNRFAVAYNAYAERLKAGELSLKLWVDVTKAWEKLK